jgi:uncharacterized protein (DUF2236 family)
MAGYFNSSSMIRVVHRENAVALAGARALLMQAAHPVAFAGFFAQTTALADPWARLQRTGTVMDLVMFGERQAANEAATKVRAVHSRVSGRLNEPAGRFPAGTPWAADDPELLLWILATLADSAALLFKAYVRHLDAAELDSFWADYRIVGTLFGLSEDDMPQNWDSLETYMAEMLSGDVLHVTGEARDLGKRVVLHPPVAAWFRPILPVANFVIIGWLPAKLRRQYRLFWHPGRSLALAVGAESTRRAVLPLLPAQARWRPDHPIGSEPPAFFRASAAA